MGNRISKLLANDSLRPLVSFLLLGAAINIGLGMGIIWFGRAFRAEETTHRFGETSFARNLGFGMTVVSWIGAIDDTAWPGKAHLPRWSNLHHVPRPYPTIQEWYSTPTSVGRSEFAAGWPCRAFIYEYEIPVTRPYRGFVLRSGIELPARPVVQPWGVDMQPRAIPLRIIPSGAMLNTAVFALIAAALWYGTPAVVRWRRARGNLCLACGYPQDGLGAGAACPECGKSAAASSAPAIEPRTPR